MMVQEFQGLGRNNFSMVSFLGRCTEIGRGGGRCREQPRGLEGCHATCDRRAPGRKLIKRSRIINSGSQEGTITECGLFVL
jgi:hypothetical protein